VAGHAFVGQDKDEPGYFNYLQCINNFSAVTAACLMVAKEKYHQIGGFDEQFEIEFNDVDFCLRLREAGYHNIYLPHVELYHYESFTRGHPHLSKESYERHVRELTLFKNRWQSYVDDDPCYSPNLTRGAHDFSLAL
jgi:GT2 family glycosyltransferase